MKVTEKSQRYRQLQIEDLMQKDNAEHEEYAREYRLNKITETENTNTNLSGDGLLEKIIKEDNLNRAYKRVKRNKGSHGIDKMGVDELLQYLRENGEQLRQKIIDGKYKPKPVRRVEIPKEEKGKVRKLGIPTVVDRVIQQAIAQQLMLIYDKTFSENSYGFRPRRGAHDGIKKCQEYITEGYKYVVDMDLEKYFDTVNQSKLIEIISRTIKDGRVISLIHKYLRAGVVVKHKYEETEQGVPQGGPLSPILSNIMLNELDRELERRGHKFVRYADDMMIFCKSKRSAERTLRNILPYIEGKLFLKVNREKTVVDHVRKVKFLGFSFYRYGGKGRVRIHPKAVEKMRKKIRELTSRSNGWGNDYRKQRLKQYITGWVNYYGIADMKVLMWKTDEWYRRRLRMLIWKQWKRVRTRMKNLRKLGIPKWKAYKYANTRKKYWRIAKSPILNNSITTERLKKSGYIFFSDCYRQVSVN
jgi:group II intron reverse transcriptase/maturase